MTNCIIGLEGRGVGGDGGHCNNSKLDELNVNGGIGSNGSGINGANNPNRKKKKKRRHRFDYVFQHQRTRRPKKKKANEYSNGRDSITYPAMYCTTASINNTQTGNRRFPLFSFFPFHKSFVSILPVNQP
jgi:hypothetical protein